MHKAIPSLIIETVDKSTSFISTDTARFELKDERLYYVFTGTAYNVDIYSISFDFRSKDSDANELNGPVSVKKIRENGYNYSYEIWSDISNMEVRAGRLYPHVLYGNKLQQDAIDFHWASKGLSKVYNNKHYRMDSEYNMPVLEITKA